MPPEFCSENPPETSTDAAKKRAARLDRLERARSGCAGAYQRGGERRKAGQGPEYDAPHGIPLKAA